MSYTKTDLESFLRQKFGLENEPRVHRVVELFFADPEVVSGRFPIAGDANHVYNTPAYWDKASYERGEWTGGPPTWKEE